LHCPPGCAAADSFMGDSLAILEGGRRSQPRYVCRWLRGSYVTGLITQRHHAASSRSHHGTQPRDSCTRCDRAIPSRERITQPIMRSKHPHRADVLRRGTQKENGAGETTTAVKGGQAGEMSM